MSTNSIGVLDPVVSLSSYSACMIVSREVGGLNPLQVWQELNRMMKNYRYPSFELREVLVQGFSPTTVVLSLVILKRAY